ncbi:hypothetical protein GUJ93_ZPchr0458g22455 [Zizania palustris]|uniref:U-box domain-containing protein n=1 Tax=Zizania palustris TaxID=103762 RepID=A0A8J5V2U5_ZIZPA|nr:hypothetical protein GUJ93_ZPchr0458g22455 [Zizania palustris]
MEEEQQQEVEVEVPSYFLCPISLQIMCDPVILPTGITYDRDGIERWLLSAGTCPLTKQPVPPDCDPTPNHTPLLVDRARVAKLVARLHGAATSADLLDALREIKDVAAESDRNRKLLAAVPGTVDILAAVLAVSYQNATAACDEALEIICLLQLSEQCLLRVIERDSEAVVDALVATLQRSNTKYRAHAAVILANVTTVMSPNRLVSLPEQVFGEMAQLLRDKVSNPATKAALHVLIATTSWGRNRIKAVDAGAVPVLIDMLLDGSDRRSCELMLGALDRLCGCAEGRAALVAHGAGVAVVGTMILRVSDVATDKAVRMLRSVARHAATAAVVQEMAQTGVVSKLCLVAESAEQCSERTRERARETLRLHARAWRKSPCLQPHLQALYPSAISPAGERACLFG